SADMSSASLTLLIWAPSFGVSGRISSRRSWTIAGFMILARPHGQRRRLALPRLRYRAFSLFAGSELPSAGARGRHSGTVYRSARRASTVARPAGQPHERLPV